jgi:NAD(P)-dependent dehydrogenase (short-subunit alcohol dehydrogenase family)
MEKRFVLITGCSTGIGRAVASGLKKRGYQVLATVRQDKDVESLEEEGFVARVLDLRESESINAGVDWALEQSEGNLYGLFNNGAYGQPGAVEDLSRETLRTQFESNFFGTHELTTLILPEMLKRGEGRIIQNSSILGLVALPFRGAYNASKFALEGLTDTLRLELNGTGVHVSLIEPGPILTAFRENALKAFEENINPETSRFREKYHAMLERLKKPGPAAPGTLPAESCLKPVVHALESSTPKAHYYVTWPTYLLANLKRALPAKALDKFLLKVQ